MRSKYALRSREEVPLTRIDAIAAGLIKTIRNEWTAGVREVVVGSTTLQTHLSKKVAIR